MQSNKTINIYKTILFNKMVGYCLLLCLTGSIITGCNKDFLQREPLDAITDVSFWKTEEQLKYAVNGCYAYLKGKSETLQDSYIDYERCADNIIYPPQSDYLLIGSGSYDFTLGVVNNEWNLEYAAIRRCNHFLENYNKAVGIPEANMKRYVAEVRFLRAHYYSFLTFFFGDVQLITKTLNIGDPEIMGSRTPRKDVVDFILTELEEASKDLPNSYPAADAGRITKGAALGWKAKVALFYERWAVAEAAAKAVMDLNVYQLYSNGNTATSYQELFTYKGKLANGTNKESILVRPYLANVIHHNMSRESWVPDQVSRFSVTKSLVDAYLCSDGKPISTSPLYSEASYTDLFNNRDPRMKQTVLSPGATWGGLDDGDADANPNTIFNLPKWNVDKKGSVTGTGYYNIKYVEPTAVSVYNRDANDIHLLRYAEILLTYAEARMEQNKLTQTDLDNTINKLRQRVGMVPMVISELATWGMDLREEIRRERRIELALEGHRYFDLLRWKQGALLAADTKGLKKTLVPAYNQQYITTIPTDANGYLIIRSGRNFDVNKHYLWPVPLAQFQLNPALGQNPNWSN
jgi:starch-binding outer membrane protein, SusD/RagB family